MDAVRAAASATEDPGAQAPVALTPETIDIPDPWTLSEDDLLARLSTGRSGLASQEAEQRAKAFGPNQLPPAKKRSALARLASQFNNVLIYALMAAGTVTFFLNHVLDTAVIWGVAIINALIGFIQEGKAEQSLEAIQKLLPEVATVIRDGVRCEVSASALVPGDIVSLQAGDRVPADLRMIKSRALQTQEAALTGESLPVDKTTEPVAPDTPLGDRTCVAFSSTIVSRGQGLGVVVATAEHTEIGQVKSLLQSVRSLETPLTRQMSALGTALTIGILAFSAAAMAIGILVHGKSATEMFLAAVGIAVAAIPEGLPAIVTITLAIGVERMAKRRAIIRRLPAVETLGAVSVICSDKTGTFTRNEMMVQSVRTSLHVFTVTGDGYVPEGDILLNDRPVEVGHRPLLKRIASAAALCNDARLYEAEDGWAVSGDPMEGAMLSFAGKAGHDVGHLQSVSERFDEIPFDSEIRYMATFSRNEEDERLLIVKGAPEQLLDMCGRQVERDGEEPLDKTYWQHMMAEMADRGERVLAVAIKPVDDLDLDGPLADSHVNTDLILLGCLGFIDPPRTDAIAAVARCQSAGINVKMITGDHIGTAQAIGKQIGLDKPHAALNGTQLEHLSDEALADIVEDVDVFARTDPAGKLRIVRALQAKGHVTAMTGDGVNDAPALKQAEVGIAMGLRGTEAAKETGEMVLTDDNFSSIAAAVEEGRTVYDNLVKSIQFILPTNGGEGLTLMIAVLFGLTLPITAVQILWVNMVTAVTLALALAFEAAEGDIMARPPRAPRAPFLSRHLLYRIGFVSVILMCGVFGVFMWKLNSGASLELARTAAVNTLVLFEVVYLFVIRRANPTSWREHFIRAARPSWIAVGLVMSIQMAYTYLPFMNTLFRSAPMDLLDWLVAAVLSSTLFIFAWAERRVIRRFKARARTKNEA